MFDHFKMQQPRAGSTLSEPAAPNRASTRFPRPRALQCIVATVTGDLQPPGPPGKGNGRQRNVQIQLTLPDDLTVCSLQLTFAQPG